MGTQLSIVEGDSTALRWQPDHVAKGFCTKNDWESALSKTAIRLPSRASENAANPAVMIATPPTLALQAWYDSDEYHSRPLAILSGTYGVGKTTALCWIALHRFALDQPLFVTAPRLARMPRADRLALIDSMFDSDDDWSNVLLIDDLGSEHLDRRSGWLEDFDEIVDRFYREQYSMVLTTNLKPNAFERRYGGRVCDRLAEAGKWITVTGESMRGRADDR